MKHEQIMEKAWSLIRELGITEDKGEYANDPDNYYLVENIYTVRDAFYSDIENNIDKEGETLEEFFSRHNIEWE